MQIALIAFAAAVIICAGMFQLAVTVLPTPPMTRQEFLIIAAGVYCWVYLEMRRRE